MSRFDGKNILIVGVYGGIGQATAQRLAGEGARIVGVGRQEDKLQAAIRDLPGTGTRRSWPTRRFGSSFSR